MDYVYVPVPERKEAITERTYESEKVFQKNTCKCFKDKPLADFMHENEAKVIVGYDWEKEKDITEMSAARSLKIHLDPEFDGLTYGDYWKNEGRIPYSFDPEDCHNERHIFFYAGLAPYPMCFEEKTRYYMDTSQRYQRNVYLIAHFKVKRIFSIEKDKELENFKKDLSTNAHFIEKEHLAGLKNEHSSKLVIIKGQRKGSKGLLRKAIQLTKWSSKKGMYVPFGIGERIGIKEALAIRQAPVLDPKETGLLLEAIASEE